MPVVGPVTLATIPASTIPAAKAYLWEQLVAVIADESILVSYDEPGPRQPNDIIVVGAVDRQVTVAQMVGSGAAGWLDEIYTIDVVVSVFRGGDYARTAFERACVLADVVVAVVRGDPSLDGLVIVARPENLRYDPELAEDHKGRLVTVTIPIYVHARI